MEQTCSEECFDDNSKLESKVILALSRLQKGKGYTDKKGKSPGINIKKIVEYLCANYCHLDGDIESQVITALKSCVKNGIVCALENGKYRLVGPRAGAMASNCISLKNHGPKCSCLSSVNNTPNYRVCCNMRKSLSALAAGKKLKRTKKLRSIPKKKTSSKKKGGKKVLKKKTTSCVLKVQRLLSDVLSKPDLRPRKCEYCLEIHPPSGGRKICLKCHPPGTRYGVPFDKFSPREEVDSVSE